MESIKLSLLLDFGLWAGLKFDISSQTDSLFLSSIDRQREGAVVSSASPYLSPLSVDVSDAVGQWVWSQQSGRALRPVHCHQRVFAHQHLPNILRTRHPDQRATQEVSLEHVAILLSPWGMEAWTLHRDKSDDLNMMMAERNITYND